MNPDEAEELQAARHDAVRRRLAATGVDALLVTHPPNVRYLCGFTGTAGMLLVDRTGSSLFTDGRYAEQAASEAASFVDVAVTREGLSAAVAGRARRLSPDGVAVEALHLTLRGLERLREEAPEVAWEAVEGWVEEERERKAPAEVEAITRAAGLAEDVLARFLTEVSPGTREGELAARLEFLLREAGSEGTPFDSIVASGPRSSLPHARPTPRRLEDGDLLLVDFGAVVEGYCSDVTRTVVVGSAAPWQTELHGSVRRAQQAALDAVAPGARAADVDRAAREVLERDGLGEAFLHSTGHGIGLEVHEEPRLHRTADDRLEPGHVVTVEPGAYLEGRGGVRIEDDVLVTDGGGRRLTTFSRGLTEL